MLITSTLLLMVLVIVPAVPPLASSLLDACGHRSFLFILDMSQHPSTLWVECQDKVRLDSPRNLPCSRDSLWGQGDLKGQSLIFSPLISLESQKVQVPCFMVVTDQRGARPDDTAAAREYEEWADWVRPVQPMAGWWQGLVSWMKQPFPPSQAVKLLPKALFGGKLFVDISLSFVSTSNSLTKLRVTGE